MMNKAMLAAMLAARTCLGAGFEEDKARSGILFDGRTASEALDASAAAGGSRGLLKAAGLSAPERRFTEVPPPAGTRHKRSRLDRGLRAYGECFADMHRDQGAAAPWKWVVPMMATAGGVAGAVVSAPGIVTSVGGAAVGTAAGAAFGAIYVEALSAAVCLPTLVDPLPGPRDYVDDAPQPQTSPARSGTIVKF